MNSKGLAQLAYEKGMYILAGAQSYQAALEAEELGHGYLTFSLVEEGLKTPAADFRLRKMVKCGFANGWTIPRFAFLKCKSAKIPGSATAETRSRVRGR